MNKTKENFKIIFMGTPDFAVESLKSLYENSFNIAGVITAPDKPAGRGKKISESAVKKYANEKDLNILQPTNLKNEVFLNHLKSLKADLQVVVAFRMLPEIVWSMPKYGTINLHASLLPNYRGAAPINHAVINGESVTGLTTFFIEKEIDTGKIIYQEKTNIEADESAGELHDKLMFIGGNLIVKTVNAIIDNTYGSISQKDLINNNFELKSANKIFKEDCLINWDQSVKDVYNFIRGLSPYPAAWSEMVNISTEAILSFKIYKAQKTLTGHEKRYGEIKTDNKSYFKIFTKDGYVTIQEIQLQGKKRMTVKELLNGFDLSAYKIKKPD